MTTKDKRKRTATQHQHTTQKGLEVEVKFEWVFFCDFNKQYILVFGDAKTGVSFLVGDVHG
jgi:hypothetical protein